MNGSSRLALSVGARRPSASALRRRPASRRTRRRRRGRAGPIARSESGEPRADAPEHLVADRVAEGVVDLLEAVEVDEQECEPAADRARARRRRSASSASNSAAAVGEPGQVIGDRLADGAPGSGLAAADREPGAHDHQHQRGRGQGGGHVVDGLERPDEQDPQAGGRGEARQQEAGRPARGQRVARFRAAATSPSRSAGSRSARRAAFTAVPTCELPIRRSATGWRCRRAR